MNSKFNRFALLAVLPITTWACQCSEPVALDEPAEEAAETTNPQVEEPPNPPRLASTDPTNNTGTLGPDDCLDADGDLYGVGPECLGADCDDSDPGLGADGTRSCFTGPAGAEGVGACQAGKQSCSAGVFGPCEGEVLPSAEVCDGVDNNCDGAADDAVTRSCYPGPEGTSGVGVCVAGMQTCSNGSFGECVGSATPQFETCDGADNNCNGEADENTVRITRDRNEQSTDVILRPVDVIFVVDNSGSMIDEIVSIQNNINNNFAELIANSGIDFRVIFLSQHGSATSAHSVCIRAPLSGNGECIDPVSACPVNTDRFFHYSVEIQTHDSLAKIISTYNAPDSCGLAPNGWSAWLRPDAAKVFIEITDSGPSAGNPTLPNNQTADSFEAQLFALSPALFGTSNERGYMFHTIAGLQENNPATEPWLSTDPLVQARCSGNGGKVTSDGLEYQKLSVRTGGLRYPICEYQSFDGVFRNVATGIIERTQMACDFKIANVPAGTAMGTVGLEFISGSGGTALPLTRVANEAACTGNAFFVSGMTIELCPGACTLWQNDTESQLDVIFGCGP